MRASRFLLSALFIAALASGSGSAFAITVNYTALDLPDPVPGTDRWQYAYTINAGGFVPFGGLNLLFDPALYAGLAVTGEPDATDWMTPSLVIDPDPLLPADGLVTLTALNAVDSASFIVEFDWFGAGTPGAQAFEVFDDFLTPVSSGQTLAAGSVIDVPEPSALLLLSGGVLAVTRRCRAPTG